MVLQCNITHVYVCPVDLTSALFSRDTRVILQVHVLWAEAPFVTSILIAGLGMVLVGAGRGTVTSTLLVLVGFVTLHRCNVGWLVGGNGKYA